MRPGLPRRTHPRGAEQSGGLQELRARRDELTQSVAEMTLDLGGLTYEMAIRDHFRLEVLARRAAALQEADGELGEVERLLAAAEDGTVWTLQSGAIELDADLPSAPWPGLVTVG